MKIAYFGFDLFYDCLEYLVESGNEIVRIFTCDVDRVYEFNDRTYALASRYNIPVTVQKPDADSVRMLEENGCELIVSAGYYYKIPLSDRMMCVNVHPSLLPRGRGPWPFPVTILKNDKTTGVTLHKLAKTFDSGDVILQVGYKVSPSDNLDTLTEKSRKHAVRLLEKFMKQPRFYYDGALPQAGGEYWKEPSEDEMVFDITDPFDKINRITRAFYDYHCYLSAGGKTIAIKRAKCTRNDADVPEKALMSIDIAGGTLYILKLLDNRAQV